MQALSIGTQVAMSEDMAVRALEVMRRLLYRNMEKKATSVAAVSARAPEPPLRRYLTIMESCRGSRTDEMERKPSNSSLDKLNMVCIKGSD